MHSISRRPEPYSRLAMIQVVPEKEPDTDLTSSLVRTTGSFLGFFARTTPFNHLISCLSTSWFRLLAAMIRLVYRNHRLT